MAASLPTESAADKAVQTFGLGPYDEVTTEFDHGEDSNNERTNKQSLPGKKDAVPDDPDNRLLSYPGTFSSDSRALEALIEGLAASLRAAAAGVPGDADRPPSGRLAPQDVVVNRVPSVSQSEMPGDEDRDGGPRADYYDRMSISYDGNEWPDGDSGAYASDDESESLPSPAKNDTYVDNGLGAAGNSWQGFNVQDQSDPAAPMLNGSPQLDFQHTNSSERIMKRTATNFNLVRELTTGFIKECGKKDLTRRHVMAFLQKAGSHQYLASDVVRCLLLDHNVYVKDVLDEFPVRKQASSQFGTAGLASIRSALIELEVKYVRDPEVSSAYRAAAAAVTRTIAALERI